MDLELVRYGRKLNINPRVASGGVIYPQTRFSHHCTKTAWNFFECLRDFSQIYVGYRTPQKFFPTSVTIPQILVRNKGHPQMAKNWFQAYLGLGMPLMEKSDVYIHVFTCNQASGSSGNFSWRHMQTGSRNPLKPEVVITRRREDISTWSQRLRHTFWACPIHLHMRQPRPTTENAIWCKPEVETLSQTGSTINLATETDIDAISVSIPMFLGARFSLVYMPTSPDDFFTQKLKDGGRIPEVVITLRRKRTSTWSQCSVDERGSG